MKSQNLYKLLLIGIILIPSFSYAQTSNNKEEKNLKFKTCFFEALKQKAIENYDKAIESLEKCYAIDSLNTAVQFEFSKNYFLLSKYYEAELFIDKALEIEPENSYLLQYKIAIFRAEGNYKDAIEIQKKIIQKKPKYKDLLVLLYIQNQDFDKAEKLIIEIEENALSTQRIKGFKKYLKNRKSVNIARDTQTVLTIKNNTIAELKEIYNQKKEFKILQKILNNEVKNKLFEAVYLESKNALELFPAQPYLYKMNGFVLNKLGKYKEAIYVLTIGIDFVIDNTILEADFYEQLSVSYEGLKQNNQAIKYKQKAKELRNLN